MGGGTNVSYGATDLSRLISRVPKADLKSGVTLNRFALAGLSGYQQFISPYKGFGCAYGVAYGRGSCSDIALRITRRFGAMRMLRLIPLQAARCKRALMVLQSVNPSPERQGDENSGEKARPPWNCDGVYCVACCPWP